MHREPAGAETLTLLLRCDGELMLIERVPQSADRPGFHVLALAGPMGADQVPSHGGAFANGHAAADPASVVALQFVAGQGARACLIDLARRPALSGDPGQIQAFHWAALDAWLGRWRAGELLLTPDDRAWLEQLAEPAMASLAPDPDLDPGEILPVLEYQHGLAVLLVRSHTLPPAEHTNCFVLGAPGARLIIDPSPADEAGYRQLRSWLAQHPVQAILITHHHADHREHANRLARELDLPMWMSAETADKLRREHPRWFEAVALRLLQEGEAVADWLGQPVRVIDVPGHDNGHLALMPDNRAWCIVGDLIQAIGTVVIARPDGNMRQYFQSLQNIIERAPRVVYPSHGGPSRTTLRLEQTLAHRRQREAQVLALHRQGLDLAAMLGAMYPGLPAPLNMLARMNIEGHLDKLREEGVLE